MGSSLWLVECFRVLVQSGCPCPAFSSVPTVFRIDRHLSPVSPRTLSSYLCDPHHPFSFISTPSLTYHFPLRIPHMFELLPLVPSNLESTRLNTFLFHNQSAQHLCVYFLLFYSFNSIVHHCFIHPPHTQSFSLSGHRCGNKSSLSNIDHPCSSCRIVLMSSIENSGMSLVSVLHRIRRSFALPRMGRRFSCWFFACSNTSRQGVLVLFNSPPLDANSDPVGLVDGL